MRFLGISIETAFLEYNLAPLSVRRQIAALGLIHRCVLKKAPGALLDFFYQADAHVPVHNTRLEASKHDRQILDLADGGKSQLFKRSVFGSVRVYNRLAQHVGESDICFDIPKVFAVCCP